MPRDTPFVYGERKARSTANIMPKDRRPDVTQSSRPRSNPRRITVLVVKELSPRMRRVTFGVAI